MRSVPVGNVVYVALTSSGGDQVAMADRHIDHSVLKVQMFLEFNVLRKDICDFDSILVIKVGFPVIVSDLLVYHFTKNDISVSTGASTQSSI